MSAEQSSSSELQKTKMFVCDQHATNILWNLQKLYKEELLVDIALTSKTGNIKVHAHRAVLSASSGHFRTMLCSSLKEARADVIQLEIDGATLKLVIDFMYSGTIDLCSDNVGRIQEAADILKMRTLKDACVDFIDENSDLTNRLSMASMGKEQHSAKLDERAFAFAIRNFEEVRKMEDFFQLTEDNLSEIISSDDLCVDSEESVFHSLVSWMEYDKANRVERITKLLTHVRFSLLKPEFISANRTSLCKTSESSKVIMSWLMSSMSGTKLSKRHSERRNANGTQRLTLGFVSGDIINELRFQTLNPESTTWTYEYLPPPPEIRTNYRVTAIDKKIIVPGGWVSGCSTNTVLQLDLETMEWTELPPMREARELPGAIELNGDLYVVGGRSDGVWLYSVEKYDFRTREWQELAPMHSKHEYIKVTILDGLLYAVGECDFLIESYNPANDEWIQIPIKNERSEYFGIVGVGECLYAVGGSFNGQRSKTVERYHPATKTWTLISPGLGIALSNFRCVSWNNRLIACRGYDDEIKFQTLVEEYNPVTNEWKTLAPLLEYKLKYPMASLFTFKK